ncbi:MAG: phosphate/phosphite/phosphonate ABC transporter substrate-binding protein [Chloroflexi bacterium]|nr:phosphate/phosphite/phosphonate ABC transporter substrate-binding protein [Chloroflexota bacterium]
MQRNTLRLGRVVELALVGTLLACGGGTAAPSAAPASQPAVSSASQSTSGSTAAAASASAAQPLPAAQQPTAAVAPVKPVESGTKPAAPGEMPATLRVGLVPNQAPDRIRAQYKPFGDYLNQTLKIPVELFVATDYAGVVEAMANDKLDIAYFGGLTYLQAEKRAEVYPIVTEVDRETGTTKYYSAIITRPESPVKTVADIRGKKFAFGDVNSTSGSLYPRILLDRAGIGDFTNQQLFVYSGGHDATTLAVANGTVDAGGVEKRIMQRLIDGGQIKGDQIRIVEQTLVEGYPWVVRAKLDTGFVEKLTQAFLDINDQELLKLMRAEKYAKVTAKDYDEPRRQAARVGLLK